MVSAVGEWSDFGGLQVVFKALEMNPQGERIGQGEGVTHLCRALGPGEDGLEILLEPH